MLSRYVERNVRERFAAVNHIEMLNRAVAYRKVCRAVVVMLTKTVKQPVKAYIFYRVQGVLVVAVQHE